MVQTRRQYRAWVEDRGTDYATSTSSQDTCESCSQRSDANSYSYEGNDDTPQGPSYRPNDHCKRHRTADSDPYTEDVVSYRRRKPRN